MSVLIAILVGLMVLSNGRMNNIEESNLRIVAIEQEIEAALIRQAEIADRERYMSSFAFIENIARQRLGLVRRDEIIFILREE